MELDLSKKEMETIRFALQIAHNHYVHIGGNDTKELAEEFRKLLPYFDTWTKECQGE